MSLSFVFLVLSRFFHCQSFGVFPEIRTQAIDPPGVITTLISRIKRSVNGQLRLNPTFP